MSTNPKTPTAALADMIARLRTVADELEAAANGKPAAQLDSTVGDHFTHDGGGALHFTFGRALRCGTCGDIDLNARIDGNGECLTCAALPRD